MKEQTRALRLFGIFFLLAGCLWLFAIYQRGQFAEVEPEKVTFAQMEQEITLNYQSLKQSFEKGLDRTPTVASYMSKIFIVSFWCIAVFELLCSLLYIFLGFALLRGWRNSVFWGMSMLAMDVVLKILIIIFHFCFVMPLDRLFSTHSIISLHFMPADSFLSVFVGFFSGAGMVQDARMIYIVIYFLYLVLVLKMFGVGQNKEI